MAVVMQIILSFLLLFISSSSYGQSQIDSTYKGKGFSLVYPKNWKTSNEDGILNFFPSDNSGAITVSTYSNIAASVAELKKLIVEVTSKDPRGVDSVETHMRDRITEINYECIYDNTKWVARMYKKNNDIFFLTLNSTANEWIQKKQLLLNVFNSFKLVTD